MKLLLCGLQVSSDSFLCTSIFMHNFQEVLGSGCLQGQLLPQQSLRIDFGAHAGQRSLQRLASSLEAAAGPVEAHYLRPLRLLLRDGRRPLLLFLRQITHLPRGPLQLASEVLHGNLYLRTRCLINSSVSLQGFNKLLRS